MLTIHQVVVASLNAGMILIARSQQESVGVTIRHLTEGGYLALVTYE